MREKKYAGFLWYSAGSTLYLVCLWLLGVLVVRLSGYEDAGILSLAMSATNVYVSVAGFGMHSFQVSDAQDEFPSGIYIASRLLTAPAAYAVLAAFVFLSRYDTATAGAILAFGLFRAAESAIDVLQGFSQKHGRLDALGKSVLMRGIGFLTGFFLSLALGAPLVVAILSMLLVTVAVAVFYDLPVARRCCTLGICWDNRKILLLLGKCAPLLVSSLLSVVAAAIPRYVLEQLWGSEALGYFASVSAPSLIVQVLASYLYTPLIPVFSNALAQADWKLFNTRVRQSIALLTALAAAALLGSLLLGRLALRLLYGRMILPYAYLLIPAILCSVFTAYIGFFGMILTVLRDGKGLVMANIGALLTSLFVSAPLIRAYSLQGANYAAMAMLGVSLCISLARFATAMKGRSKAL